MNGQVSRLAATQDFTFHRFRRPCARGRTPAIQRVGCVHGLIDFARGPPLAAADPGRELDGLEGPDSATWSSRPGKNFTAQTMPTTKEPPRRRISSPDLVAPCFRRGAGAREERRIWVAPAASLGPVAGTGSRTSCLGVTGAGLLPPSEVCGIVMV